MENQFRIFLNLNNYFHDHRSFARIFINEKLKTIDDLHIKIREIFDIEGFNLICQNSYLPPSEDVRLLSKDDVIWVVPSPQSNPPNIEISEKHKQIISENDDSRGSKKRKKKTTEHLSEDEEIQEVKKKKSRQKISIAQPDFDDDHSADGEREASKRKTKKNKSVPESPEKLVDNKQKKKHQLEDDVDVEKVKSSQECTESLSNMEINHDELVEPKKSTKKKKHELNYSLPPMNCQQKSELKDMVPEKYQGQGALPYYRRRTVLPTVTDEYLKQRKVNIVKIVQIKPKDSVNDNSVQTESKENSGVVSFNNGEVTLNNGNTPETEPIKEEIILENPNDKKLSVTPGDLQTDFDLHQNESLTEVEETKNDSSKQEEYYGHFDRLSSLPLNATTEETINGLNQDLYEEEESIESSNISNSFSELNQSSLTSSTYSKKSLSGLGQFMLRLRNETPDSSTQDDDHSSRKSRKRTRKRKKKIPTTDANASLASVSMDRPLLKMGTPISHIKFEDVEIVKDLPDNLNESPIVIDNITINDSIDEYTFDSEILQIENNILKLPRVSLMTLKNNDVILYKILRINEDYSPSMSTYIVGKVLYCNPELRKIELKILHGLDQCSTPRGKLAIDLEENDEGDIREVFWQDLFQPRLLHS